MVDADADAGPGPGAERDAGAGGAPEPVPFDYPGGTVAPGETENLRYPVSETYLGDPIRVPVTVVNGARAGPTAVLTAAAHGDELNGVEVVRTVAHEWDHDDLAGTLVCLPVLNVPGFLAQQRHLPIVDRDLNRAFPGGPDSTSARRIAHRVFEAFVAPCEFCVDFHTSTRGRTNALHVRANMDEEGVARLARALATNVLIDGPGPEGSLRRAATEAGVPAVTVELGRAHRFQRELIDRALTGVESVLAEYGMRPDAEVAWPGWRTVVEEGGEDTWVRADAGGLVEMHRDRGELVREGDRICTITDPFKAEADPVRAPFTGLLVGVLENPVAFPGNPLCHLVRVEGATLRAIAGERTGEGEGGDERADDADHDARDPPARSRGPAP